MRVWEKVRELENLHITLWLIKDFCWVALFKPLGMFMIIPTVFVSVYITTKTWSDLKERLHNLAVLFWILANSTWMTGEFYFNDSLRPYAISFFVVGIMCIAIWHVMKKKWSVNE